MAKPTRRAARLTGTSQLSLHRTHSLPHRPVACLMEGCSTATPWTKVGSDHESSKMNNIIVSSVLASVVLLTGCGGGGDGGGSSLSTPSGIPSSGSPPPVVPAAYNAQSSWSNLLSTSRGWTVTGRGSDGSDYELALTVTPAGSDIFPVTGATGLKSIFRNRLSKQSVLVQDVLNEQFTDAEFRILGSRVSTDGGAPSCSRTDVIAAVPPTVAAPGSSGPLYAATTLSDCSASASALGNSYHSWSVVADGAAVFLCIASSNRFLGETADRLSETCVETDANGNLGGRARITLTLPGFSVVAIN